MQLILCESTCFYYNEVTSKYNWCNWEWDLKLFGLKKAPRNVDQFVKIICNNKYFDSLKQWYAVVGGAVLQQMYSYAYLRSIVAWS